VTDHNQARENLIKAVKAAGLYFAQYAEKAAYTSARYENEIRAAAAAYWKEGVKGSFVSRMKVVIKFGLKDAFDLGASDFGVTPDEYSKEEIVARDAIITEEQLHIPDLLKFIDGLANDKTRKLTDADYRLDLWIARFADMQNRAKLILGKDTKFEWVYGDTEHCDTCQMLNGFVKRASFWNKYGVHPGQPPNPKLQCGGWRCQCQLNPTEKNLSRGKFPRLTP
jgi:hypothetical protein